MRCSNIVRRLKVERDACRRKSSTLDSIDFLQELEGREVARRRGAKDGSDRRPVVYPAQVAGPGERYTKEAKEGTTEMHEASDELVFVCKQVEAVRKGRLKLCSLNWFGSGPLVPFRTPQTCNGRSSCFRIWLTCCPLKIYLHEH